MDLRIQSAGTKMYARKRIILAFVDRTDNYVLGSLFGTLGKAS